MLLYIYESKEKYAYIIIYVWSNPQIIDWLNIWNHQRATDLSSSGTPGYAWSSETRLSTLLLRCTRHKVIAMQPWRRANSPNLGDIVGIFTWIHAWTYIYIYVCKYNYIYIQYMHTYITLHYFTFAFTFTFTLTLHYIVLIYITYIKLHFITLHCITLHYITLL